MMMSTTSTTSPPSSPTSPPSPLRLVAVTPAGEPVTPAYARLVDALRKAGAEVRALPVPPAQGAQRGEAPPSLADLKAGLRELAQNVGATLRGEGGAERDGLSSLLRSVEGPVDGVVAVEPRLAARVFSVAGATWPAAVRIGVDADFHVDPEWRAAELDDLVTPHPALGGDLPRIREGRARLRSGGPVVGGDAVAPKRLDESLSQVVVSFARLDAGDVDPLLFQLSLARPENFSLLLLPSGRPGVDELVRNRAANYGLRGKRPRASDDAEPWIRGAAVLVGHPSPAESASAVSARVPQVLFAPGEPLAPGDAFLVQHELAVHCPEPLTIAVQLEALLPGGGGRAAVSEALQSFEVDGAAGAARAVLEAVRAGRPAIPAAQEAGLAPEPGADELEDIGGPPSHPAAPADLSPRVRQAYLKEIIIQEKDLARQVARTEAGLASWRHRLGLARSAADPDLVRAAAERVEGLERILSRLRHRHAEVLGLRDRFAGRDRIASGDRDAAARFLGADAAAGIDTARTSEAFRRLELDDALRRLKRTMGGEGD